MNQDLQELEKIINRSDWLEANILEPRIGDPDSPAEAEPHGTRGLSLYTAFIEKTADSGYNCKFELCSSSSTGNIYNRNLEEVIRHIRHHHFNHSPFVCTPANGAQWYVSHRSSALRCPLLGW
jgi:hypothetical protein